ncbi:hypothetical protein TrRE_jg2019 [Triparma retinervis]|uniref:Uncharacterized protein n=1 Tax=Triparma retinervis TaxID=2557542 RepID=A0A9W7E3P9_9STRA|nr:hypothetical protein TrRE_jg2019 [Triparma retinervis]
MLAADKLQLQSSLKQRATALKEKEFNLHHSNLMTVGTQAAVLASLDVTMFIEFNIPDWEASDLTSDSFLIYYVPRCLKFIYYLTIVYALCSNLKVVAHTTALAVLGTSLALRGPDGSMIVATEGLYSERSMIFKTFGQGLIATVFAAIFACFLVLHWETATIGSIICICAFNNIIKFYKRVRDKFNFDENTEAIDLTDMFSGPANVVGHTSDSFSRAISRANGMRGGVPGQRDPDEEDAFLRTL